MPHTAYRVTSSGVDGHPRPKLTGNSMVCTRTAASGVTSVALHICVFGILLVQWARPPFGSFGPTAGHEMQVSLVDGFAAAGAEDGRPSAPLANSERDRVEQTAKPLQLSGQDASAAGIAEPPSQREERAQTQTSFQKGSDGRAALADHGANSASTSRGGDPTATTDLLRQIARCLPREARPDLRFSNLVLEIGEKGELRAAPAIQSLFPRLTVEDRLAADRVVQAALQCGPYNTPSALNRVISLVPDFSAIRPSTPERIADALSGSRPGAK